MQPPVDQLQRANSLFTASDWKGSLEAYSALAKAFPAHPLSRFRIGVSLMELRRFPESEASLREGEKLGIAPAQAAYRLAQLFAEQQRPDSAVAELRRSLAARLPIGPAALESDRHLAPLKARAEWHAMIDAADAIVRPCMHDPRAREFDFWIGDWDVRATGLPPIGPAARNTVTLNDNGCVVTEHWTAPGGSEGQSFNLFDRSRSEWRQTWVDNSGGEHNYRGALRDGNMALIGDTPAPGGRLGRVPTKLTFFHISRDSVRQFSEVSSDSGRTWQTNYDLMYVRRKDSAPVNGVEPLTPSDLAAIRALDSTFVRGWLADDTTTVLSVFDPGAVLLPPGAAPVVGKAAMRAYWWPTDGSRTRIRSFERTIQEIEGNRTLAFIRGTGALGWEYTKDGKTTRQTSRSTDLIMVSPDPSGRWRVIRQMWNALP